MIHLKKIKLIILLLFLFLIYIPEINAQKENDQYEMVIAEIEETIKIFLLEFPGISIAIGHNGSVVWSNNFGYANLEYKIPVSNKTKFRVYSIAKTWTATATIILAERGLLNIYAPVQNYVPSFPQKEYTITPYQLATHTSGIRHYKDESESINCAVCETVEEALVFFKEDSLLFEPGSKTLYSSWGYVLLSAVIENVSKENYLDFMQSEIFDFVDMSNTVYDNPESIISNRSGIYTKDKNGKFKNIICSNPTCKWGAGGFLSTAEDVAEFTIALLSGEIISQDFAKTILNPDKNGISIVNGEGAGGRAQIWTDINKNLVIIFVGNAQGQNLKIQSFAEKISSLL